MASADWLARKLMSSSLMPALPGLRACTIGASTAAARRRFSTGMRLAGVLPDSAAAMILPKGRSPVSPGRPKDLSERGVSSMLDCTRFI